MSIHIEQIDSIVTSHLLHPERVVVSAAGIHCESTFLMVIVSDGDGNRGYGEAATTLQWSGESACNAKRLVDCIFAPRLLGATFDHPRDVLKLMDQSTFGNSFTKSAVDTAVWDLWAKQQNVGVHTLFGDQMPLRQIPTRVSLGAYPLEKTLRLAREFWDIGVRTLKFKTGVSGMDDAVRLRAVRDELGDEPVFTVDCNGSFRDEDEAVRHIESLLPMNIALVEQPTHRDRIHLMAAVRKRVPIPILADECIFTPEHLAEALDLDAFDYLSVYPGKNGGFGRCLAMIEVAARAGKPCTIGNNGESDLGHAALAALAGSLSAFPVETLACDLAAPLCYVHSSITEPLILCEGALVLPAGIGFGVTPVLPGLDRAPMDATP